MMRLEMRDNIDNIVREMRGLARNKLPTAAAKALTFTAERVQLAEKAEMARVFDRPTRWTLNSIYKRSATATRLAKAAQSDSTRSASMLGISDRNFS